MYTQCPDCGTVFKVTAEALRAAQGAVRCGICSTSFSALDYLSEQPLLRPHDEQPRHDDTITVEELPGTEFIELSSAGDAPAGPHGAPDSGEGQPDTTPAAEGGDPSDERAAAADPAETSDEGGGDLDAILEFRGSAEDLEKLFVERSLDLPDIGLARPEDLEKSLNDISGSDFSGIEVVEESLPEGRTSDAPAMHPGEVAAVLAFRRHERDDTSGSEPPDDFSDPLSRTDEYPILTLDERAAGGGGEPGDRGGRDGDGGDEVLQILIPEELRRAAEQRNPPAEAFAAGDEQDETGGRRWPLVAGLLVLLLVLAAQATHFWRTDLVRHPYLGPWLLRAYALAGLELEPPVDLSAFELTQLGAANDPAQAGRLKVRASIVNHAPFAQPYPVLRLSLQDRFGTTVGVRNLEPAEYLPGGGGGALLAPSRRADAEVVFVDPGRDAVGYELDVCLRDATGIRCSAELTGSRP